MKKGLKASEIHAERPVVKNKKCYILLGDEKLFVEIELSKAIRNRNKASERWSKELQKLKKYSGKSALVLFIAKKEKEDYPKGLFETVDKFGKDVKRDRILFFSNIK